MAEIRQMGFSNCTLHDIDSLPVHLSLDVYSMSQPSSTPASSSSSAPEAERRTLIVGMANMILSLLSSAWFPLDLSAHQDALILSGNLLSGW